MCEDKDKSKDFNYTNEGILDFKIKEKSIPKKFSDKDLLTLQE